MPSIPKPPFSPADFKPLERGSFSTIWADSIFVNTISANPNVANSMTLSDENKTERISLQGKGGELTLSQQLNSRESIKFEFKGGDLNGYNPLGIRRFQIHANGGEMYLYDKNGRKRIFSSGEDGRIAIFDKNGTERLSFDGEDVVITNAENKETIRLQSSVGDILLNGADCAEKFEVQENEKIDSGTVLIIGNDGKLYPCKTSYDKKVAGIVSGANGLKPGIILNGQQGQTCNLPVALTGRVYCKVDTQFGSIEIGDLLTTSPTLGHAMKVTEPTRAFGSVVGKALKPLKEGMGMIPVLVSLQ